MVGKLYGTSFPLVDVTIIHGAVIMDHRSMAELTLLQNHIHQRYISTQIASLATLLMEDHLSSPQVIAQIHYLEQDLESADSKSFVRELALRVPKHGTIAQQLEQKGI